MTMHQETIVVPPIVQYLDGLVDQLRMHTASVIDAGLVEAVHQARVTTRRLKAAGDLLRPLLKGKARQRFQGIQRKVRRQFGPIRDLDVLTAHLADFTDPDVAPAAEWMLGQLQPMRAALHRKAAENKIVARLPMKLEPWYKVRGQIIANAAAIDALLTENLHDQVDTFAARADELLAAVPGVDPHLVRIAGKALRYTLEIAAAHGHPLEESLFKSFKKMQDALGTWHDYVVLTEQAMLLSAEHMVAHHNAALQHGVLALAGASLQKAEDQLAKFNRLWGEQGKELTASIREAFPLSREVVEAIEQKTDRDLHDSAPPEDPDGPH